MPATYDDATLLAIVEDSATLGEALRRFLQPRAGKLPTIEAQIAAYPLECRFIKRKFEEKKARRPKEEPRVVEPWEYVTPKNGTRRVPRKRS